MKFGDAVAIVAQPIARGLDYAFGTDLRNCQGCIGPGGRKDRLNQFSDDVLDFFSGRLTSSNMDPQTQPKPQFIVTRTKQILVTADTPELADEAVAKGQGQTISMTGSVQLRQQPPQVALPPQAVQPQR